MFLFTMEGDAQRVARLSNLVERALHRLGDSEQKIWSYEEILGYIEQGGREIGDSARSTWDVAYLEPLAPHFSATADWEVAYETFFYGVASYTSEDEVSFLEGLGLEPDDVHHGVHTSPSDLHVLEDLGLTGSIPGLYELPEDFLDADRAVYDEETVVATTHHRVHLDDHRYQFTRGDVVAFQIEDEGYLTLRMIRVPSEQADLYEYEGSWGLVRDAEDATLASPDGSWGVARQAPGHFTFGSSVGFGVPRRYYIDDDNFKLEYWRQPRVSETDSDLPFRYWLYLADFAQWKALWRNGPGQNYKLGQLYKDRWERGIARINSRRERRAIQKVRRMGGDVGYSRNGPPRPRYPWQYGSRVR